MTEDVTIEENGQTVLVATSADGVTVAVQMDRSLSEERARSLLADATDTCIETREAIRRDLSSPADTTDDDADGTKYGDQVGDAPWREEDGQELRADGGTVPEETHLDPEQGLWIPPALRSFTAQVVFRTPRHTIQHFGSDGELDPYYGLIDGGDFDDARAFRNPKNPDLAPDKVSIKPQGEAPVVLEVDLSGQLRADGGASPDPTDYTTVFVVRGQHAQRRFHSDSDCRHLAGATVRAVDPAQYADAEPCGTCVTGATDGAAAQESGPKLANVLADADPEDIGLDPVGEPRTDGGEPAAEAAVDIERLEREHAPACSACDTPMAYDGIEQNGGRPLVVWRCQACTAVRARVSIGIPDGYELTREGTLARVATDGSGLIAGDADATLVRDLLAELAAGQRVRVHYQNGDFEGRSVEGTVAGLETYGTEPWAVLVDVDGDRYRVGRGGAVDRDRGDGWGEVGTRARLEVVE